MYDPNASAEETLRLLVEGNRRFASGACRHPNTDLARVIELSTSGQKPFAAVIACSDSRVPVERVFDRGVGDLFVVREAGNVCGTLAAASLEFAVTVLGCGVIVVMGHTGCGAVQAACSADRQSDTVEALLHPIRETARSERDKPGEGTLEERVTSANVMRSAWDLERASPAVADARRAGTLVIAPAVYDLSTGVVEWLEG
ncbi:MAG: carbonic anhydrase [Phycisphaeraceae bacterium]|nr:MAG: carbonic anhydrase [Phycisphaeraceae bacterium]